LSDPAGQDGERLYTLTGAPGRGKTHLALEVAHAVWESYAQGAWFVDLSSVGDPRLVAPRVLAVLDRGRRDSASPPSSAALASITARLSHWEALLVLDHCDQTMTACAELVRAILAGCPRVRVLATARQALGVEGERIWSVPALTVPPDDAMADLSNLAAFGAVRCFLAAAPALSISAENGAAVASLCRRLEGNPLALRLVAGQTGSVPPEVIVSRIERARTTIDSGEWEPGLRLALDWRYAGLGEAEQLLFRRLAVCRGGWSFSAAQALVSDMAIRPRNVQAYLERLAHGSLVKLLGEDAEPRYAMPATLRPYAAAQLAANGETKTARRLHLAWCLDFAETAVREADGPDAANWTGLEFEHDNMREALAWQSGTADGDEQRLRLAAALAGFRASWSHADEGRRDLERLLAEAVTAPPSVRARALHAAGRLAAGQGDLDGATVRYEQALALFEGAGDDASQAAVLSSWGNAALERGDLADAEAMYERSGELSRRGGDRKGEGESCNQLGLIAHTRGSLISAMAHYTRALSLFRRAAYRQGVALALLGQATVDTMAGDAADAARALRECLVFTEDLSGHSARPACLIVASAIAGRSGDAAWAARLLGAASTVSRASSALIPPVYRGLASQWEQAARHAIGAERFEAAWEAGSDLEAGESAAEARRYLAAIG
jgi:predicted ATPase